MSNYVLRQERNKIFSTHLLCVLVFTVHSINQINAIYSCHDGKSLKRHVDHTEALKLCMVTLKNYDN